jgi:hypothetical protein
MNKSNLRQIRGGTYGDFRISSWAYLEAGRTKA